MKVELWDDDNGHEFHIEPETVVEKCALDYLAYRPTQTVRVTITRLGVFMREVEGCQK